MRATHARVVLAVALASLLGFIVPASPAAASGKTKKNSGSAPESKSLDDMMGDSAKPKKSDKKSDKKTKPSDDKSADSTDDKKKEEAVPEPAAWEKPPEEEKTPPKKVEAAAPEDAKDVVPAKDKKFEAGLLLGWGFDTDKVFSVDPYGLGFGLRLGYEFDFKLFVGLGYEYFLGSSDTLKTGTFVAPGASVNSSANYMFGHVEAGYDVWVSNIIIRPSLWLGLGFGTQNPHPQTLGRKTVTDFFFAPGVSVIDTFSGTFFFGGDLRLHKVTGDGSSAVALYATGGLRF